MLQLATVPLNRLNGKCVLLIEPWVDSLSIYSVLLYKKKKGWSEG